MKLQGMSIVFALVIVPIILVLTYYIQLQVDTINLQTEYDTYLLNSTYDAMSAFELNTANEDLSTVSDSLRTIIEASYNVFIHNLLTNLGMSNATKSRIDQNIPSVLYTLYDGYYICAPTKVPTVLTDSDGNAIYVGDKGVKKAAGASEYYYDETSDEFLKYENDTIGTDYGQLLYLKDGATNVYTTNINDAKLEIKNVLKTYMPYSARYVGSNFDLTVIYTLDNYLTVEGTVGKVYYTKSGYLIPTDSIKIDIINPENGYSTDVNQYNQNDIQDLIEKRMARFTVTIKDKNGADGTNFTLDKGTSKADLTTRKNILDNLLLDAQELWYSIKYNGSADGVSILKNTYTKDYLNSLNLKNADVASLSSEIGSLNTDVVSSDTINKATTVLKQLIDCIEDEQRDIEYELGVISAVTYYSKAYIFSNWVKEYLCDAGAIGASADNPTCIVREDDLVEVAGQTYTTIRNIETLEFDFKTGQSVFSFENLATGGVSSNSLCVTEIPVDSPYYQHKLNVIKMSIQYNLNLAMSTYNDTKSSTYQYEMPVINAAEWDQILTHISITTFMQGARCGLKIYNNYKIVSSTNNDILTLPEDIYYVKKDDFNDEESEYHKINCNKLIEIDKAETPDYISFGSKSVKYDKIANKNRDYMNYEYDHKNYACYDCINDGNYFTYDIDGDGREDTQVNIFNQDDTNFDSYNNLRKAYYIGVGKVRNDTYKMNAFENSEGYEVTKASLDDSEDSSSLAIDRIKAIELSFGTIYSQNETFRSAIYTFDHNGNNLSNDQYSVATNNSSNNSTQSIRINVIPGRLTSSTVKFITNIININCESNDDIVNSAGQDARTQLRNSIKYIRIIYK